MYKNKLLLLLGLVLIMTSCTLYHVNSVETTDNYYPSKESANEIAVLNKIDRAYEEIGTIVVNAERNQSIDAVLEKMKYEASILGGDAITDIKSDATGTWKSLPAQELISNGYVRANFIAKVIVFKN